LGQRLREARRALGLTQEELGRPDFTKGFISLLEHDRAKPSVASLERLAARLGRPVSFFLDGSETVVSAQFLDVLRSRGRAELAGRLFEAALETFREMRQVAPGRRDAAAELHAAVGEGEALLRLGRLEDARTHLQEACVRAHDAGAAALECRASYRLAEIEMHDGRYAQAAVLCRAALDLAERLDGTEPSPRGEICLQLGTALYRLGRLEEAAEVYRTALTIFEQTAHPYRVGEALYRFGAALAKEGDYAGAMLHYERAVSLLAQDDEIRHLADVRDLVGALLMQLGRPAEAVEHYSAGLAVRRHVGDPPAECRTLTEFARCLNACGDRVRAREVAERAAARSREAQAPDEEARAQALLGALAAAAGDLKEAQRALSASAEHCERAGMTVELVAIYKDLAQVAALTGRYKEAAGFHERAFRLLQNVRPADLASAVRPAPAGLDADAPGAATEP
jgi:tetratricopeptide (TPR) repeat protein